MFKKPITLLLMAILWLSLLATSALAKESAGLQQLAQSVTATNMGSYDEAIRLNYQAIEAVKNASLDHRQFVTSQAYANLGTIYWIQGKYGDAETTLKKAIQVQESYLPTNHSSLLMSYNNLANIYKDTGRYGAAEPLYRRAIEGMEKTGDPELAAVLDNLGENYRLQGAYAEAEPLYKRAIALYKNQKNSKPSATAKAMANLATLKLETDQFQEALELYKKSLELQQKDLPAEHPHIGMTQGNIGTALISLKQFSEAQAILEKALKTLRNGLPSDHPYIALHENNLCIALSAQQKIANAEVHCLKSLEIYEQKLGPDHAKTRQAAQNILDMYILNGQPGKAEAFRNKLDSNTGTSAEKDYSNWEQVTPEGASEMVGTPRETNWEKHRDLSLRYMYQGRFTQSEAEIKRALETARDSGEKESVLVSLRDNLGSIYRAQKKYEEALTEYQYSLDYQRNRPDRDAFSLVITLANIGEVYQAQKNYPEAEKYLLEAISLTDTSMPMADIPYATLGFVYKNWGKPDKAETMLAKALELSKDRPAEQTRQHRPGVLRGLFSIYLDQGRFEDALPLLEKSIALAEASGSTELRDMRNLEGRLKEAVSLKKWNWHMRNAQVHLQKQAPDQAEKHAQEALSLIRKLKPDSAEESATLTVLGSSQLAQQQFVQAKTSLSRAKTLAQQHYPSNSEPVTIINRLLEMAQSR